MSNRLKPGRQGKRRRPRHPRKPGRALPDVAPAALPGPMPAVPMFDWHTFDPSMLAPGDGYSFVTELTTYRDRLSELLEHAGEYVVIKGRDVIGIYPERDQALLAAIDRFGEEPTLVKEIVAREPFVVLGHG